MSQLNEQQLIGFAETYVTALLSGVASSSGADLYAGVQFVESGHLFRSELRRFLKFFRSKASDSDYRVHWSISRCKGRSVHIRVYLTPVSWQKGSNVATLRLRLHIADDGSLMRLMVIYNSAKLIACFSPNRLTASFRRFLYALGLYKFRF
ncbi:MAG: hypothetical protein EBZ67_11260 [Chitinophagia bacterium]|nr:hypothetical protein [Chitinophagia bacterium]